MRSTFRVLFFLKRDKQKSNGEIPIFCRITIDKEEARFGIKKDVNPKIWDVKAGRAVGRTSEVVEINSIVDKVKSALFNVYNELLLTEVNVTAEKGKLDFFKWNPDKAKKQGADVKVAEGNKTQVAVNSQGKTNEATKNVKEPLKQGQQAPTEQQQQQHKAKKTVKKSSGVKM